MRYHPYVPRLASVLSSLDVPSHTTVEGSLAFVDISGFTALSERLAAHGRVGAEVITTTMTTTFTSLLSIAQTYGGDLRKFGGDALLLLFSGETHAQRASAAVAEMHAELDVVGKIDTEGGRVELGMSAGVASGPVDVFVVGDVHRELIFTGSVGDAVAAVETAAERGQTGLARSSVALLQKSWVATSGDLTLLRHDRATAAPAPLVMTELGDVDEFVPVGLREALGMFVDEGEHRSAGIAFAKITGLDAALRHSPDLAASQLNEAVGAIQRAALDHEVTILATDLTSDGTKVILAAGVPETRGENEERLLRAARAVVDRPLALPVKFGVNAGHVFAGDVGAPFRRTYTVMGDTVNLAARLVERADAGMVLASETTLARTRTRFRSTPVEPFLVKGKTEPIHAAEVGDPEVEQADVRSDVPLIGRDEEIAALVRALERTMIGRSGLFEIVAESGMGKSRLVAEAVATVDGVRTFTVVSDEYTASDPYISIRRLVRAALGIPQDGNAVEAGTVLTDVVGEDEGDLAPWLPLIGLAIGAVVDPTPEVDALDASFLPQRMGWVIAELLVRRLVGPTHFIFEDAHWMDDASAGIVGYVIERVAASPWVVTVTRRPGPEGFVTPDDSGATRIHLGALDRKTAEELIRASAGDLGILPDDAEAVAERSGGHPMFIIELAAAIRHEGRDSLPTSIDALISERIDRLPPADRRTLRYTSVLGRRFDRLLAAEVVGRDDRAITPIAWSRLRAYVEPVGASDVQFRHAIVRDAAYAGLPFRTRRHIHSRAARSLHARRTLEEDFAELLSLHHGLAGEWLEAWNNARVAGDRAASEFANGNAVTFYRRALDAARHLRKKPRLEVGDVAERLGDAADLAGMFEEARSAYSRAASLVREDPVRTTRVMLKRGLAYERVGRYSQALRSLRRAMNYSEDMTDDDVRRLRVEIRVAYAGVRFRQSRYRDCIRWCEEAVERAPALDQPRELAHAYYLLDHALSFLGQKTDDSFALQALDIFNELGDRVMAANVLNNLGVEAYNRGQWDDAADYQMRHADARRMAGDVMGSAIAAYNAGLILLDQGRDDEAEIEFTQVRSVAAAAGHAIAENAALACLGTIAARRRDDHAFDRLDRAIARFQEIGAAYFTFDALLRKSEAMLLLGDAEGAEELAAEALKEAGEQDGLEASIVGLRRVRGVALLQSGQSQAASQELNGALDAARSGQLPLEELLILVAMDSDETRQRELKDRLGIREMATATAGGG